jgi:hypothetical protein
MACPVQFEAGVVGDGGNNGDADDSLDDVSTYLGMSLREHSLLLEDPA